MNGETPKQNVKVISQHRDAKERSNHPSWIAFIQYCTELEHGEIEMLKIQHGLPVLAEITRKKVKFSE